MSALSWLGRSYHRAVERREERAVIRGVRCLEALLGGGLEALLGGSLEALLGGGLEALLGGGSPELQR